MKRIAFACLLFAAAAPVAGAAETASVADLAWMAGTWTVTRGETTTRETWLPPLDGAMGGVGQTSRKGKPAQFEFMSITTEAAGPTFTARVGGQPPTPFVLKPGGRDEAVFENLAHDFPQRVIYRRCGEDLCGRIEGTMNGKAEAMDWRYRRP